MGMWLAYTATPFVNGFAPATVATGSATTLNVSWFANQDWASAQAWVPSRPGNVSRVTISLTPTPPVEVRLAAP